MPSRWLRPLLLLLVLLPAAAFADERYLIAYGGFAGFQAPVWAAKDFGLLNKYGLNAETVMVPGSPREIQALLAGSVHFAQVDAVTTINAITQGADLVMISGSRRKRTLSASSSASVRRATS